MIDDLSLITITAALLDRGDEYGAAAAVARAIELQAEAVAQLKDAEDKANHRGKYERRAYLDDAPLMPVERRKQKTKLDYEDRKMTRRRSDRF